jgi:hypothetical protein
LPSSAAPVRRPTSWPPRRPGSMGSSCPGPGQAARAEPSGAAAERSRALLHEIEGSQTLTPRDRDAVHDPCERRARRRRLQGGRGRIARAATHATPGRVARRAGRPLFAGAWGAARVAAMRRRSRRRAGGVRAPTTRSGSPRSTRCTATAAGRHLAIRTATAIANRASPRAIAQPACRAAPAALAGGGAAAHGDCRRIAPCSRPADRDARRFTMRFDARFRCSARAAISGCVLLTPSLYHRRASASSFRCRRRCRRRRLQRRWAERDRGRLHVPGRDIKGEPACRASRLSRRLPKGPGPGPTSTPRHAGLSRPCTPADVRARR